MGLIYKVTNLINQKIYIGQTQKSLEERRRRHYSAAKSGHRKTYFCRALLKYKEEDFLWEVLEDNISLTLLDEREVYYIKLYNTFENPSHYNLTPGGFGYRLTQEIRDKISIANTGKVRTKEMRENLSKIRKGMQITHTEETKQKISKALKGRKFSPETLEKFKAPKTEEWKQNISKALKGRKLSEEHKKHLSESHIKQCEIIAENEKETLYFNNRKEAYNEIVKRGLTKGAYKTFTVSIRNGIRSNQKRYGFRWTINQ